MYQCDVCSKQYKGVVPLRCTGCDFSFDSNARRYVETVDHDGTHLENPVVHIFDGLHTGFCREKRSRFHTYQANESESQGGVDRCDQCGKVCRIP